MAANRDTLATVRPSAWVASAEPADSAGDDYLREAPELLALRLRALRDAMELGAPLSTAEVLLLLGASSGGERVNRAGPCLRKGSPSRLA